MSTFKHKLLSVLITLIAGFASHESAAAEPSDFAAIVRQHENALVTVKYVLHVDMGGNRAGQEQESENEQTCTMISADGCVARYSGNQVDKATYLTI